MVYFQIHKLCCIMFLLSLFYLNVKSDNHLLVLISKYNKPKCHDLTNSDGIRGMSRNERNMMELEEVRGG